MTEDADDESADSGDDPEAVDADDTDDRDSNPGREGADDGDAGRDPFRTELDEVRRDLADVADDLDDLEERIEDRTVPRDDLERDLRRYVRQRLRRGHARDWGPYLVLLYGTAMTIGAFYFLDGGWAVLAMLVIWLSTLGLYVLMLLVGVGLRLVGGAGRLRDALGSVIGALR